MSTNPAINSPIDRGPIFKAYTSNGVTVAEIYAYAYDDSTGVTYVSGNFAYLSSPYPTSTAGNVARAYLGAFGPNGEVLSWAPTVTSPPQVIRVYGSYVYLGGYFEYVSSTYRPGFAVVHKTTGALSSVNPNMTFYNPDIASYVLPTIQDILIDSANDLVHVTGYITQAYGVNAYGHVAITMSTGLGAYSKMFYWYDSGSGNTYTYGPRKMALYSGTVYCVGYFNYSDDGGYLRLGASSFTSSNGATSGFAPEIGDYAGLSITVGSGTAYLCGSFSSVNSVGRNFVAAVDSSSGALLSWYPTISSASNVSDIYTESSKIYLHSSGTTVNGVAMNNFSVLDSAGVLASTQQLFSTYASQTINIGQNFSPVSGGLMDLRSRAQKVWDTRYTAPRN